MSSIDPITTTNTSTECVSKYTFSAFEERGRRREREAECERGSDVGLVRSGGNMILTPLEPAAAHSVAAAARWPLLQQCTSVAGEANSAHQSLGRGSAAVREAQHGV